MFNIFIGEASFTKSKNAKIILNENTVYGLSFLISIKSTFFLFIFLFYSF